MPLIRADCAADSAPGRALGPLARALAERGLALAFAADGPAPAATVRVLPPGAWADDDAGLASACLRDAPPTLLLADDDAQVLRAFEIARAQDDVARLADPAAELAARVGRLLARAGAAVTAPGGIDALTGLPDRQRFEADALARLAGPTGQAGPASQASQAGAAGPVPPAGAALLRIDLDRFSAWNARHGSAAGDAAIARVAAALAQCLSPQDLLGRLGGDEFAVLACRADAASLARLGDALRIEVGALALATPDGVGDSLTASVGVAPVAPALAPAEALAEALRAADLALFDAQSRGGDRCERFAPPHGAARPSAAPSSGLVARLRGGLLAGSRRPVSVDRLTQVWNRAYFERRLAREIEMTRKDGRPLALAVFDLDAFGEFNARHGLAAGDEALRRFADLAANAVRPVDWFARLQGNRFALVLPGTVADARHAAGRIQAALAASQGEQRAGVPPLTASVGVAAFAPAMTGSDALLAQAVAALQATRPAAR